MNEIWAFITQQQVLVAFIVWAFLAALSKPGRTKFVEDSYSLISAPSELDKYPQDWLISLEKRFETAMVEPLKQGISSLGTAIKDSWTVNRWKLVGQLLLLIIFPIFIIADAIVVVNALEIAGYRVENLNEGLQNLLSQYGIAVAVGTFFSFIISSFVFFELHGHSEFSDMGDYTGMAKLWFQWGSFFVLFISFVSGVSLGLPPLGLAIPLPEFSTLFVEISLNMLVRVSVLVTSALILVEALKGLRTVFVAIQIVGLLILIVFYYLANIMGSLGRIFIDFLIRAFRWLLLAVTFLLIPLDFIVSAAQKHSKRILGGRPESTQE